jgi:hypothetical protein
MTFQNYLQHALDRIDRAYKGAELNPEGYAEVAQIILDETSKRLAKEGKADLHSESLEVPPFDPVAIKTFLIRCVAAGNLASVPTPPLTSQLTPPAVAKRYRVSPDTVRLWIKDGKLAANNPAQPGMRPRYRITEQALADFDNARGIVKEPAKTKRRRTTTTGFKRY